MLQIYLAGLPITINIPIVSAQTGKTAFAQTVSYRVVNQDDVELVPLTAVSTFTPGSATATVQTDATVNTMAVIPADSAITNNMIGEFSTRESRTIELHCAAQDGNVFVIRSTYGLEGTDPLHVGLNSFQTLPQAELTSMDIVGTAAWDAASDTDKIAAMIESWNRVCQLNFWLLNSNVNWGQDNLNYIPEGVYQSPYVSNGNQMFIFNGNLALLTPTQYANLPYRFKNCLKYAQVAESDFLLGGDQTQLLRQGGVILETIGESKQMFRTTKALELPVSKRALKYLSQFVTFSKRIGRG